MANGINPIAIHTFTCRLLAAVSWAAARSTAVKAAVLGIVAIAVTPVSAGALAVTAKIKRKPAKGLFHHLTGRRVCPFPKTPIQ
jgi:hypothetical protein